MDTASKPFYDDTLPNATRSRGTWAGRRDHVTDISTEMNAMNTAEGNHMKEPGTRRVLHIALFLIVFSAAAPLRAQTRPSDGYLSRAYLDVCDTGTVAVVVLTAKKYADFQRGFGKYSWEITTTVVPSGKCRNVFWDSNGDGVDLAFVFADAKGQWGAGTIAQVPDLGTYSSLLQTRPVMSKGNSAISVCAPLVETSYKVDDSPKVDCATMRLTPVKGAQEVHGPFVPVTAILHFEDAEQCLGDSVAGERRTLVNCNFYLNVSPGGTGRDLHAMPGAGGGVDADPQESTAQVVKELGDMLAKLKEKYPAPPPPPPPAPPKRDPTLTIKTPEHDGYAIKMDPSLNAVLAGREQEKWKAPMFMVSAYDPKWIGQTLVLKGTVSRVDVERDGDPKWVHIYFKESPDATITGCSPFPDMLRKTFGTDLSTLVGKTIEMAGQVEKFCSPNISIRIVDPTQIKVMN